MLNIAYPNCAYADPKTSIVIIFARVLISAVAALGPVAVIADNSGGTQRYYEVRGAKLYTEIYVRPPHVCRI